MMEKATLLVISLLSRFPFSIQLFSLFVAGARDLIGDSTFSLCLPHDQLTFDSSYLYLSFLLACLLSNSKTLQTPWHISH